MPKRKARGTGRSIPDFDGVYVAPPKRVRLPKGSVSEVRMFSTPFPPNHGGKAMVVQEYLLGSDTPKPKAVFVQPRAPQTPTSPAYVPDMFAVRVLTIAKGSFKVGISRVDNTRSKTPNSGASAWSMSLRVDVLVVF